MSEMMVDRVTKAIRLKSAEIDHRPGNPDPDGVWFADEFAAAALAAIREPTDEMISAGLDLLIGLVREGRETVVAKVIWHTMIDAALAYKVTK